MLGKKTDWRQFLSDLCYDLVDRDYSRIAATIGKSENTLYCYTNRNKPQNIPNSEELMIIFAEANEPARVKGLKRLCQVFEMAAARRNGDLVGMLRELADELEVRAT